MAIRNDVTIHWELSPRIIEVLKSGSEPNSIAVQDLYDTLRYLGCQLNGIDEPEIVEGEGKAVLTEAESVCLTVILFNAKVKFEERTSWTICKIEGGNLVAKDESGQVMSPIEPSPYVNVDRANSSSGTLVMGEGSPLTEEEHNKLMATAEDEKLQSVKTKTDSINWNDITIIKEIEQGRWKIANNQMIFYKPDNVTELMRFNLFNKENNPAMENVFDRVKV